MSKSVILKTILCLIALGILAYLAIVAYVCLREKQVSATVPAPEDYDAIVVLGAQVKPEGDPSVQLAWRLDAALEAWRAKPVPVIVCGAQGADEPDAEAHVMKAYLSEKGIPEGSIHMDDTSFNTNQNLTNAGEILAELEITKALIVTSDYHAPRAMALAGDMGLTAVGLGSPCKAEYWVKNHFREALAWCKYWAVKYLKIPLE